MRDVDEASMRVEFSIACMVSFTFQDEVVPKYRMT